ncbi:RNA polymerase sigma factor [Neobacillus sp. WH10]|uniref:RNA polymerase sigma factor n=1 Tax=Neobacillus sp. WH10 TaxID=3047873 RepID=UPI0024C18818|nr:RNA polymerase sigma factor [Neobacillus sp. WH10]WHY78492.1 RNA polymerase sigma factor [Neobacillus sp. WH10]
MESIKDQLFFQWYEEYSVSLLKYIFAIVHEPQTAEDLLQETFLKVYEKYDSIQDVAKVKSFLFRAAHNTTMDFFRKESKVKKLLNVLKKENVKYPSTEKIVEIKEEGRMLLTALKRLKPSQREVFVLRKMKEFSIKETAEILEWSEAKVKTTLHRATNNLEKFLLMEDETIEWSTTVSL